MLKIHKRIVSVLLTITMVLGVFFVSPFTVSAMTNQDGANWALARIGQWIDTDGYYGAQCKDFVNAFTQENFGVTFPGDACDLIYANLPAGWQRIQNYAEFIPEPGDIAIWGGWGSNPYGHTGIIISANLYSFESVDQNWVNSSSNGSVAARVTHNYTSPVFWGVIRPPYQANVPNVDGSWISVERNLYISGATVTFSLGANNAENYVIGIDKNGTRVVTQAVGTNPSFTFEEPGNYSAYATAWNSISEMDSNTVWFDVVQPENLGDEFYAMIMNTGHWKPIENKDGNIVLGTENKSKSQLWKFERQENNTYKIISLADNKVVDLLNAGNTDGTNIQMCSNNNSDAQRWYIVKNKSGYLLIPRCSQNGVMDLTGNNGSDGTNIEFWTIHGGDAQTFSIYKIDNVDEYLKVDDTPPTISNARAENISGSSFDIKCDLYDDVGVERVWLNIYGPNYSNGYAVSATNGEFTHTINTSDYGGAGLYSVHVYAFDACGNETPGGVYNINAVDDTIPPTISNARAENVSGSTFDIKCDLSDNVGVTSVWVVLYGPHGESQYSVPASNGTFTHTINTADYGGPGLYSVRIYAYDEKNNESPFVSIEEIPAYDYEFGDANGDGEVNIQDATLVQMYVAKYKVDNFNEKLADYDQSGGVNIQDATAIQMKVAKLV